MGMAIAAGLTAAKESLPLSFISSSTPNSESNSEGTGVGRKARSGIDQVQLAAAQRQVGAPRQPGIHAVPLHAGLKIRGSLKRLGQFSRSRHALHLRSLRYIDDARVECRTTRSRDRGY